MVAYCMGAHTLSKARETATGDGDVRLVLDSIRRIVRALRVSSRAAEKKVGISGAQLFVLQKLADGGRALSINELARRTVTDQSSVSVVVQKLVKQGLVSTQRSRADGRRLELALAARGRQIVGKSSGAAQQRLIESLRKMTVGKRRQLASLLDALVREAGIADAVPSLFFESDEVNGQKHS
jgi:DNA-binding MarR family transcriptional regulator